MLLGMGFTSYDDQWVRYNDIIPYIFSIKMDNVVVHTDSHAHNSTFAILAELGVVGYILFILLFSQILSKIKEMEKYNRHYSLMLLFSFGHAFSLLVLNIELLRHHRWFHFSLYSALICNIFA